MLARDFPPMFLLLCMSPPLAAVGGVEEGALTTEDGEAITTEDGETLLIDE